MSDMITFNFFRIRLFICLIFICLTMQGLGFCLFEAKAQVTVGSIQQVSVGVNNTIPAGASGSPAIAINGQQLVFNSSASNLVEADTNSSKDIFQTALLSGITTRASVNTAGVQANGDSSNPSISPLGPDGVFAIAFESDATNLSSLSDRLSNRDIFIRIPSLGLTEIVSVAPGLAFANGSSRAASITLLPSPNRVIIAFESDANNLVSNDTNKKTDIFIATLTIPSTANPSELLSSLTISRISAASEPDGASTNPKLSGDGSYVVFTSVATNLLAGVTTSGRQVFRYSLANGEISLVSKDATGIAGNGSSYGAAISYTGRYVSYITEAPSIISGAGASTASVVVLDTNTSVSRRANSNAEGIGGDGAASDAYLSANGRFMTFSDSSSNLTSGDTNSLSDIFLKDLWSGQIARVSIGESGNQGNGNSDFSTISGNGFTALNATLAFRSFATNFTSAGLSSGADIFANSAILAARTLEKTTILEVPPDVSVNGKKANIQFESFSSVAPLSFSAVVSDRASSSINYDIRVNKSGGKKKDNIRKIVKKNQIALKRLKPGTYTSKYRVLTMKGKKTVSATKFSPVRKFTVLK